MPRSSAVTPSCWAASPAIARRPLPLSPPAMVTRVPCIRPTMSKLSIATVFVSGIGGWLT
ncbi:MAG: hypothetical protein DME05_24205 [Candidatus Rokuibacteriota bacterium]|nr:MAG: hypothetical protein DME05_24205 [Candidatus Rokubacteria bacterium]